MTQQRLEQIWRDNLRKYNGNVRLDSIIIRAMHEACNEVNSKFKNLTIPVANNSTHTLQGGTVIEKDCNNCRNDGLQMINPSKCTGCGGNDEYNNWEYCR